MSARHSPPPKPPTPSRRMTEVVGVLMPGGMYDIDAVLELSGIGRAKLDELRHAGRLTAYSLDNTPRVWFRGSDIIALFTPKPFRRATGAAAESAAAAEEKSSGGGNAA